MKLSIQNKSKQDIINIQWWQIFNILSVDVVIGALAGGVMAVKLLHVNPGFAWWIVLPLSVWIVYTIDHLIDGVKLKDKSHTVRHFFHYYYAKQIIVTILILSIANITLILFFLENKIIEFGLIAGTATLLYLLIVYFSGKKKSYLLQKEFFVALIYTVGIWGGPVALTSYNITMTEILIIASFFLTVFAAILIFSVFEAEHDILDNHNTFAVNFGIDKTTNLIYFLMAAVFIICIGIIIMASNPLDAMAFKIMMIMSLLLLIILNFAKHLTRNNIYKNLIEMIFWLPGLFLLLN